MDSIPNSIQDQPYRIGEIQEVLKYFLEGKMYTDISFSVKCGDERIDYSAHKLILSMWSPVLAEMCYNPCMKTDGAIPIEDVSPPTFDAMLKFMYGSLLSNRHLKDIPFLLNLYKAAVAYEIEALKNLCNEIIIHSTPKNSNVFQLLDAGKLLSCEGLLHRCYRMLQMKTAEVLAAYELCNITPAMVTTILDMPQVSFTSEYELISWVLAWVQNEFSKYPDKKTFKDILGDFLPYLNFWNLTAKEFAKLYQNRKGDLMSDEDAFSILMNLTLPGSHPLPSWYSSSPTRHKYGNGRSGNEWRKERKKKSKKGSR